MPLLAQIGLELFLQLEAAVIGAEGDLEEAIFADDSKAAEDSSA